MRRAGLLLALHVAQVVFQEIVPISRPAQSLLLLAPGVLARVAAEATLAGLDFELMDVAQTSHTAGYVGRAARMAPLLRQALSDRGVEVVAVPPAAQAEAESPAAACATTGTSPPTWQGGSAPTGPH